MIIPSRTEGLPIRLLEAWSAKLPVLATRVGDNDRYVKNNINGYLVNCDSQSIKEGLQKALDDNNLAKISNSGFRDVQEYIWPNIARSTIKEYRRLYE